MEHDLWSTLVCLWQRMALQSPSHSDRKTLLGLGMYAELLWNCRLGANSARQVNCEVQQQVPLVSNAFWADVVVQVR